MILLEKKWRLPEESSESGKETSLAKSLLFARGIRSNEEVARFLSKEPDEWHDPFLMNDMDVAVERICTAVTKAEKILICGDYDADGVTSTTIMMAFLRKVRANVEYVIPDRMNEGYGISDALSERIRTHQPNLLITVDCGVANEESILALVEEGMDVIVTDHHEVKETLPPAMAVIDCKRADNRYPFEHLCGAGVALKLVEACCTRLTGRVEMNEWKNYIDIAAIGTIADVVNITGENRTIVKEGLRNLSRTTRPGLRALFALIRQNSPNPSAPFSSTEVAFQIAPRINACGRMGDAARAVEMFLTSDTGLAQKLAEELCNENTRRQQMEQQIVDEAVRKIETSPDLMEDMKNDSMPIVLVGENWHAGILGIVANRLVNRYQRTAIVFTKDSSNPKVLKGSCRSAGDFPILDCLRSCEKTIAQYGGHKRAAGVSVQTELFEDFKKAVRAFADTRNREEDTSFISIDKILPPSELTLDAAEEILGLEPFGEGNRVPVFLLKNAKIATANKSKDGRHLRLTFTLAGDETGKTYDAIAFGIGDLAELYVPGSLVDIVAELSVHSWNGNDSLSIRIVDMHFVPIGKGVWDNPAVLENLYRNKLPLKQIAMLGKTRREDLLATGEEMGLLYRYLMDNCKDETNICDMSLLARLLTGHFRKPFHAFKVSRALDIFKEAGLLEILRLNDERVCFSLLSVHDKVKLEDTRTYKMLYTAEGEGK